LKTKRNRHKHLKDIGTWNNSHKVPWIRLVRHRDVHQQTETAMSEQEWCANLPSTPNITHSDGELEVINTSLKQLYSPSISQ
jgi:hypothetical protein